ncbi:MAG TPA: hypothetical protein VFZ40_05570, partial [Pyrinomonadaceae bacterium]
MLPPSPHTPRVLRREQSGKLRLAKLLALCGLVLAISSAPFITRSAAESNTHSSALRSFVSSHRYFSREDAYTRILTRAGTANPFAPLAATYFSQGSLDPGLLSSWNTSPGGGGSTPPNFTTASDIFIIQSGHNMSTTAAWTVSGGGATIQVGTGGTLTANHLVAVPNFIVTAGANYVHNATGSGAGGSAADIPGSSSRSFAATSNVTIQKWGNTSASATLPNVAWGNLTINVATLPGAWQQSNNLETINGTLTIQNTNGQLFSLAAGSASTVTIGGDLVVSGGVLNFSSGAGVITLNLGGNYNQTSGIVQSSGTGIQSFNFSGGGSSATFSKTSGSLDSSTKINWAIASGKTVQFNNSFNLFGGRSFTVASGGGLVLASSFISGGGSVAINGELRLASGAAFNGNGPTYGSSSLLKYESGTTYSRNTEWSSTAGLGYPNNVQISNNTTLDLGVGGTGTARAIAGTLTIDNGSTLTMDNGGNAMTAALTINGSVTNSGTLTLSSQSGGDLNVAGSWDNTSGVLTHNNRSVTFNGAGAQTITTGGTGVGKRFSTLAINKASGAATLGGALQAAALNVTQGTLDTSDPNDFALIVTGNVSITGGTLLANASSIQVGGDWTNNGTFTNSGSTVTLNGTSAQAIGGSATTSFANLTDSNTSAAVTFNTNFDVSGTLDMNGAGTLLTPGSPTVQVNSAGNTGTITGTGTVQVTRLGSNSFSTQYRFFTLNVTALTVEWAGAGDQVVENGVSGYGAIRTSGSGTKSMGGGLTLPINGGVTIGSGTVLAIGANNLSVAGNWSNNAGAAGFTMNSDKTITFNGASTSQTISGNTTFANLTINTSGSPGTVSAAGSTLKVTGLTRIQSGTFTSATQYGDVQIDAAGTLALSGDILVSGNWTNNGGTFTHNNRGVSFNGATGQTIAGNTSFYDFTKVITTAQTFNFTNGSTTTVTHSLTLAGLSGQLLSLRSTSTGSQWNLNAPASQFVNFVDVQDSNANGGTLVTATNSVDSTNNLNWAFAPNLVSIAVTPANPIIALPGTQQFTAIGTFSDSSSRALVNAPATWSTKTPMAASGRSDFAAAALLGRIYVAGGNNSGFLSSVESYDPV